MSDLKACPFCGSLDVRLDTRGRSDWPYPYVYCRDCDASGPASLSDDEAERRWNQARRLTEVEP